jgi:hypothetical protein
MGATDSTRDFKSAARQKFTVFKDAFRSREGFKYFIETRDTALDQHGHPGSKVTWSNEDLDPTPPGKRTWRWWNFVTFYLGLSFGNWTLGSTMVGIGLNWVSTLSFFHSRSVAGEARMGPADGDAPCDEIFLTQSSFREEVMLTWILSTVAIHSCDFCQSAHFIHCNVFQFQVCQCLSHRISCSCSKCFWNVGKLVS